MTDHDVMIWNKAVSACKEWMIERLAQQKRYMGTTPYTPSNHMLVKQLEQEVCIKTEEQKMQDKLEQIRKILES